MTTKLSHKNLAALACITIGATMAGGCAITHTAAICPPKPTTITLTALTSPSDIELSKNAGPSVARQVAQMAANNCATLSTAVADAHPEGDLVLNSISLAPSTTTAPNRTPWIAQLQKKADAWLRRQFLKPLGEARAEPGSPVLSAIAAVAAQEEAAGRHGGEVIEITDGFAEEPAPDGKVVDFDRPDPSLMHDLMSFVPSLQDLKGGCVVLVGAGAHTRLGLKHVADVRDALARVFHAAGVGFVWTRSIAIPDSCR